MESEVDLCLPQLLSTRLFISNAATDSFLEQSVVEYAKANQQGVHITAPTLCSICEITHTHTHTWEKRRPLSQRGRLKYLLIPASGFIIVETLRREEDHFDGHAFSPCYFSSAFFYVILFILF